MNRDSYRPKTYTMRIHKEQIGIEIYITDTKVRDGRVVYGAIGWSSKRQVTPAFNYIFPSKKQREQYVTQFIKKSYDVAATKLERRQAQNQAHDFKVGDILHGSWGYEQTNCEFYEVVAVPSSNYVILRELAQTHVETAFMAGRNMPIAGNYISEELRRKVSQGRLKINSYCYVSRWDGKPKHSSSYA